MSSPSEDKLWVICPVCHKANPAGARFCKHCWGAVLRSDTPMTDQELAEATKHRTDYLKRRNKVKIAAIGIASLAVLFLVFLFVSTYTDLFAKPSLTLNSTSQLNDWSMFRHDQQGSGTTGSTGTIPQGILKWSFATPAPVQSSPAVAGGTVFFGSQDSNLYAVNADTGKKTWTFQTGSWVDSSPAVSQEVVYFGSNDGLFYAVNAQTGAKVWNFKSVFPIRGASAVAGNDVYFGSDDYNLYVLNKTTGKKEWSYNADGPVISPPVISKGIVYFGGAGGYTYGFNALNGQQRLRFLTHYAVYSEPMVVDNTVYSLTTNGVLFAFNGRARTWLWEHEITPIWLQMSTWGIGIPRPPDQSGFIFSQNLRGASNASPIVAGNTIYIAIENRMVAYDLSSFKKLWTVTTGATIRSSPAMANNTLYFGSDDGKLYSVDATSGKTLWSFTTGGSIDSSPAIFNGVVYVGSNDGNLYAIK